MKNRRRFVTRQNNSLRTGPRCIVLDTFTSPEGTRLAAHTPDIAPAPWVELTGELQLSGGRLASVAGQAIMNTGNADVKITATLIGTNGAVFITARFAGGADLWQIKAIFGTNSLELWELTGGAWTLRGSTAAALGDGQPHTLTVILNGPSITAFVDAGAPIVHSSAAHQTDTSHGIGVQSGTPVMDDFRVTTL